MNEHLLAILRSAQFTIVGRLTADPAIRYLDSGKAVAKIRLAVNPVGAKKGDGSEADYFNAELWEEEATAACDTLRKGDLASFTGRIAFDKWTDKDGNPRVDRIIKVQHWDQIGSPNRSAQPAQDPYEDLDEEVPF